jgi:Uma2 family endonuclease
MTRFAAGPIEAIEHLPSGSTLLVPDVTWEEYEALLSDLGEGYGVRIHYDRGNLSIMSPSAKHEKIKDLILRMADAVADELGCDLVSFGSTTFKRRDLDAGAEPDTCFYVQNAPSVLGKDQLELGLDPPPDVVVEIDVSHASPSSKLEFYARIGVPELWRYDGKEVHILHRTREGYMAAEASRAFPIFTTTALARFLTEARTESPRRVLQSLREWIRSERSAR